MKIGEIWEYKGHAQPDKNGLRWSDDPYSSYYMDKIRIVSLNYHIAGTNLGQMIEFEAIEGEPHPMEAVYAMPIAMFLKEYRRDYNESR